MSRFLGVSVCADDHHSVKLGCVLRVVGRGGVLLGRGVWWEEVCDTVLL